MKFDLTDFLELDTKALLAVNGGASCSGGSCSSGGNYRGGGSCSSGSSYGGSCSSYSGTCGDSSSYTENRITQGEKELQNLATNSKKLSDLVNIDNLAKIYSENIEMFDEYTADYYSKMSERDRVAAIKAELSKVTVYTGIDEQAADNVLDNFGTDFLDGLCLGENIYIEDDIKNISTSTADLLGHEGVHVIQASVVGKVEFIEQSASMPYTSENPYEVAAYNFGGYALPRDFSTIDNNNQVLDKNKGWYK
jgi:hypothetical protein